MMPSPDQGTSLLSCAFELQRFAAALAAAAGGA
jgi:hypothetical protein